MPDLPEGWVACTDTHGRDYYFDLVNQCSTWEVPSAPSLSHPPDVPEDASAQEAATASDASEEADDEHEMVSQLRAMGFARNGSRRAALSVAYESVDLAIEWVLAHMDDTDFDDPLPGDPAPRRPRPGSARSLPGSPPSGNAAPSAPGPRSAVGSTPGSDDDPFSSARHPAAEEQAAELPLFEAHFGEDADTPHAGSVHGDSSEDAAAAAAAFATVSASSADPTFAGASETTGHGVAANGSAMDAWTVAISHEYGIPYYCNAALVQTTWDAPTDELRAAAETLTQVYL